MNQPAQRRKPKTNRAGDPNQSQTMDRCQTPPYAVAPLLPYLHPGWRIWESAAGEGFLAGALRKGGFQVVESDLLTGQNYFEYEPDDYDAQVTNPPYSVKYRWLARCYTLGKPFALLVPGETLFAAAAQPYLEAYGFEALVFRKGKRVDFKMPDKGWGGSAQFPTFWLTWGLNIGQPFTFVTLPKPNKQRMAEWLFGIEQLALFK